MTILRRGLYFYIMKKMNKPNLDELYKDIYEHSPCGLFIFDLQGTILSINQQFSILSGYSRKELSHLNLSEIEAKPEINFIIDKFKQLGNQEITHTQMSFRKKNGVLFYAQVLLKFINPSTIQGVISNTQPKNKVLESLINSEERFRQITEYIHDVFFMIDLKTRHILYISPAFEKLWGGLRSNLDKSDAWVNSIHPDDRDHIMKLYAQQRRTGCLDASFRIIQHNGRLRWIHVRTFPVYNAQREIYRSVGVAEDITEQINLTQERLDYAKTIQQNYNETIIAIVSAQEQKDPYTTGHQNNVAWLAIAIAQELKLPSEQIKGLELAAHVHDIGKIGIPAELLTKPTKLNPIEFDLIKTHSEIGYNILKGIHFPWPIATIVRQHHEKINGSGYPQQLTEENILLEAKIIAVADTVDAMASHRPYRLAIGINAAIEEIQKGKDILYDSKIVNAITKIYDENKITIYQ